MKSRGVQWQVDDDLLTSTGRGGLFSDGYLSDDPLVSYFESDETPLFVFSGGKRGITRKREQTTDRIAPESGYRAITAVTDSRIQFVVGAGQENGDWADSVRLSDVESVTADSGLLRDTLSITGSDGTVWTATLKDVETDRVVTFIEEASWAWMQVEQLLDETRTHLVEASQYQKSREYDAAIDSLSTARETLNEAAEVTDDLPAEAESGIQARIEQVKGRYRETSRRVHVSRATHHLDTGEQLWRDDEFERAYEQFDAARDAYRLVLDIDGLDPAKTDGMGERIEHVERNLEHLSRAPLRRAHQQTEQAMDAEELSEALARWESAHEHYRRVLELDWGRDEKRFEGDTALVRAQITEVIENILDTRRALADRCQDRAQRLVEDGDVSGARESYAEAMDYLEGAVELAREFEPAAVESLENRFEAIETEVRTTASAVSESKPDGGSVYDDFDNWVTLSEKAE